MNITKEHIYSALIFVVVIAVGLFAINQFLAYRYKAEFLSTPCDLCRTLNPHLDTCFNITSTSYKWDNGTIIDNITEIKEKEKQNSFFNLSTFVVANSR